jgi:hypothetical protein
MKRLLFILAAAGLVSAQVSTPLPKPDQPETNTPMQQTGPPGDLASAKQARAVLDQMITALGGQAFLTYTDKEEKGRRHAFDHNGEPLGRIGCGTIIVIPTCSDYQGDAPVYVRYWKWPDKERWEMYPNKSWVIVVNGESGSESVSKDHRKLEAKDLHDYRQANQYSIEAITREWLKDPKIELYYDGKAIAEQKEAEQVTLMAADHRSIVLYIDAHSHLPLRLIHNYRDPETRERIEEAQSYDNYRLFQGIQTPLTITLYRNDIITSQRFLSGVRYNTGVADAKFDLTQASK